MKIPSVGDKVMLTKDLSLTLKDVAQNSSFLSKIKKLNENVKSLKKDHFPITILKGTVLKIDRVYIRAGQTSGYNSITFKVQGVDGLPNGRFFVSLDVANEMDLEILADNNTKKELNIRDLLLHVREKDERRECAFYYLHQMNKEYLQSLQVKLNPLTVIESIRRETENILGKSLDMSISEAMNLIIEDLKHDSLNIDKKKSKKAKEELDILLNAHKDTNFDFLYDAYAEGKPIEHSEINLYKIEDPDSFKIKNPHVVSMTLKLNESTYEYLYPIVNYAELMIFVFHRALQIKGSKHHFVHLCSVLYTILGLMQNKKTVSSLYVNEFNIAYSYYGGYGKSDTPPFKAPDIYLPYDKLKNFELLSTKGMGSDPLKYGFEYYEGQNKIDLKVARKKLTQAKKEK